MIDSNTVLRLEARNAALVQDNQTLLSRINDLKTVNQQLQRENERLTSEVAALQRVLQEPHPLEARFGEFAGRLRKVEERTQAALAAIEKLARLDGALQQLKDSAVITSHPPEPRPKATTTPLATGSGEAGVFILDQERDPPEGYPRKTSSPYVVETAPGQFTARPDEPTPGEWAPGLFIPHSEPDPKTGTPPQHEFTCHKPGCDVRAVHSHVYEDRPPQGQHNTGVEIDNDPCNDDEGAA